MAISERQKQKKLEKKKNKRRLQSNLARASLISGQKASRYSTYPIHECLMPGNLFENGIGSVLWTRRTPHGQIAISAFVIDTFCLGVKRAHFRVASEREYEDKIKPHLTEAHQDRSFQNMHPACARKLIEGAVGYAADLGFSPHRDYQNAKGIFGDVDAQACPTGFSYGMDGKPLYVRGPKESISQAKRIVNRLEKKCGPENFEYALMLEEEMVTNRTNGTRRMQMDGEE